MTHMDKKQDILDLAKAQATINTAEQNIIACDSIGRAIDLVVDTIFFELPKDVSRDEYLSIIQPEIQFLSDLEKCFK